MARTEGAAAGHTVPGTWSQGWTEEHYARQFVRGSAGASGGSGPGGGQSRNRPRGHTPTEAATRVANERRPIGHSSQFSRRTGLNVRSTGAEKPGDGDLASGSRRTGLSVRWDRTFERVLPENQPECPVCRSWSGRAWDLVVTAPTRPGEDRQLPPGPPAVVTPRERPKDDQCDTPRSTPGRAPHVRSTPNSHQRAG